MADEGPTIATAYVQLVPTLAGVQGKIGEAFAPAQQEAEQAGKETGTSFASSMWDAIKVVAGPAAIGGALAGLYQIGSTFDDVADDIRVTTGKSGEDLDGLIEMTKRVGTEVPANFDKISPVIGQLSQRMGLAGDDLETVSKQFVAAGNVLGQDVDINSATAAFNAFGIAGSDVQTAMDQLYKVSQTTGTGFNELTAAASSQAPALKQLGFSFDDTIGLIGQMDKAGLNSSAVLGSMGKSLVKLAKDGEEPKAAFERVSGEIGTLVAQGNDAAAIDLASGIFGTKGAVQFVEATKNGTLNLDDFNKKIAENGDTILGAQEDTADFAESWTIFKNKALVAIEPVATAVFGFAGEAMGALAGSFEAIIGAVQTAWEWLDKYKVLIITLGVVVLALTAEMLLQEAAIIAVNVATKAVTIATNLWKAAQLALNIVMSANPIGLVVAAIVALVGAAIWAYQNVEWFRDIVDNAWEVIKNAAQYAWENVIKPVFEALSGAVVAVGDFFAHFGENVSAILNNIGTWIQNAWNNLITFFTNLPGVIWGLISSAAEQMVSWGAQFLTWFWTGIQNVAVGVWDWFLNLPSNLWNFIVGAWQQVVQWGSNLISWIWNGTDGNGGITGMWNAVIQWFKDLPMNLWNSIIGFWQQVVTWGSSLIEWIWHGTDGNGGIVGKWNDVIAWFKDIPNKIGAALNEVMQNIIGLGSKVGEWIANGITNAAKKVTEAIEGMFSKITVEPDGTLSHPDGYVTANPFQTTATGAVIPGYAPGVDSVPLLASPGEGILVPEAVRMLGPEWVYAMNRYARGARGYNGRLRGMATGGIVGDAFRIGEAEGNTWADKIASGSATGWLKDILSSATKRILDEVKKLFPSLMASGIAGQVSGFNNSQNPASFGWVRASGINSGWAWNGNAFPGGVASGTEALWNSLLNELVPQIPGGLKRGSLWGYENRNNVNSPGNASFHSFGLALDVNSDSNPNGVRGYGRAGQYIIPAEIAHNLAAKYGMLWGGDFSGTPDPMHFEIHLSPADVASATGNAVPAGAMSGGKGMAGWLSGLMGKLTSAMGAGMGGQSGEGPPPVAGGAFDPLVERWRPTVLQALAMIGQPADLANTVLNQIRTESSGNPRAINLTDSNARKGTPSKGLIQAIDSTFNAYRLPNLSGDVYDPLSNIVAGIRYAISRYGSIARGMRGVAYDDGGWLMPSLMPNVPVNLTRSPEPVLTPQQWRIAEEAIANVAGGRPSGNTYNWTVHQQPGETAAQLAQEMDRLMAFKARMS